MPGQLRFLVEADVRRLLDLDDLAGALTAALVALSDGRTSVPPRIGARSEHGLLGAMPGYVEGLGLAAKLVSVFPANAALALPSHQALIAVFDPDSGAPVAVMDGTYVTAIRTAMTAALAARALARGEMPAAAVLGAGVQGQAHLVAWRHLLPASAVRIWSREPASALRLVESVRAPDVVPVATAEEALAGAEVVFCCTDAREPVVEAAWIRPGAHVSSVGTGRELPPELVKGSRVVVESRHTVVQPPPAGAVELEGMDPEELVEIGEVLAGRAPRRRSAGEVTVYKSTGHAAEDVAAASVVLRRAVEEDAGQVLEL